MNFENLELDISASVAIVTIARPTKLNALNRKTISELTDAFRQLMEDPAVRVVIITGSGDRAFVAGADISEIRDLDAVSARRFAADGQDLMRRIESAEKPVIAAINGFALGGGLELALACHLRLASADARLGLPEIKLGIMPGFGGTQRLGRVVGRARALEMVLTGEPVDAAAAERMGLVNRVLPADDLLDTAKALAGQLAKAAAESVRGILQAMDIGLESTVEQGIALETARFALCCSTDDMREGTRAFLEKRPPQFTGD